MTARILVVEDESALSTLLRYNLEAQGYEVEAVARGDEADLRLKEDTPDLVILDWMLPGISGIELCRRVRARPETMSSATLLRKNRAIDAKCRANSASPAAWSPPRHAVSSSASLASTPYIVELLLRETAFVGSPRRSGRRGSDRQLRDHDRPGAGRPRVRRADGPL